MPPIWLVPKASPRSSIPQRDVEIYLEAARVNGLRIAYVIETHLHADFVSGHRELAARTGAQIYVGARAGAQFPHVAVRDGDEIRFGQCHLRFLETPGHTLESLCVLVTDLDRSPEPFAVLTGDTLFIGDVGRPDLSPGSHTPTACRVAVRQPAPEAAPLAGRSARLPRARRRFPLWAPDQHRALFHHRRAAPDELRATGRQRATNSSAC